MDFFVFLIEEEQSDKLWEIWVNKEIDMSFEDFKKKSIKKPRPKIVSEKEEEEIMKNAENILQMTKPKQKVGEND